jgi:acylpyruvate hydrolase
VNVPTVKLATIRSDDGTHAVVDDGQHVRRLPFVDVGEALRSGTLPSLDVPGLPIEHTDRPMSFAALLPTASKVLCVGHNYAAHIAEMGHEPPQYPTVFSKFSSALIGAYDPICLDAAATLWDWEAELAVVIGAPLRRATDAQAHAAIAGYSIANDVTARDWQRRTSQWLLGKTFDRTSPIGPWLVSGHEIDDAADLSVTCRVDGVVKQQARTSDLVFGPVDLLVYLSHVTQLQPGDVVLTGTPGGVGSARTPAEWLLPGQILETSIEGLGSCRNECVADPATT